jgi:hypothetical protein
MPALGLEKQIWSGWLVKVSFFSILFAVFPMLNYWSESGFVGQMSKSLF